MSLNKLLKSEGDLRKVFEQEIWFEHSPQDVFAFFSDARNLEMITPGFLKFRITKAPEEGLFEGALIEYRLRLRGVPIRWRTRIDVWDPPRTFVDSQMRGPYRSWCHTHEFVALDGGTLVVMSCATSFPSAPSASSSRASSSRRTWRLFSPTGGPGCWSCSRRRSRGSADRGRRHNAVRRALRMGGSPLT